jgi:hypothetical protein
MLEEAKCREGVSEKGTNEVRRMDKLAKLGDFVTGTLHYVSYILSGRMRFLQHQECVHGFGHMFCKEGYDGRFGRA